MRSLDVMGINFLICSLGVRLIKKSKRVPPAKTKVDYSRINKMLAVAAGALFLILAYLFINNRLQEQTIAQITQEMNAIKSGAIFQEFQRTQEIISNSDTRVSVVRGDEQYNFEVLSVLYYNELTENFILQKGYLPALPDGKVYQLWLENAGRFIDLGIIDTKNDQSPYQIFPFRADLSNIHISVEPAGGSSSPSVETLVGVGYF